MSLTSCLRSESLRRASILPEYQGKLTLVCWPLAGRLPLSLVACALPNSQASWEPIGRSYHSFICFALQVGMANFFLLHTSASLTINENASPDVPLDLNDALDKIAPEGTSGSNLHVFKFRD